MDRESIIKEWFYRLPKGYATPPYTKKEMDILHTILSENNVNGSMFVNEVDQLDQAFHDAKPIEDLDEAVIEDFNLKQDLIDELTAKNKIDEFNEFLSLLPGGESLDAVQEFFNTITPAETKDFVKILYTEKSINALDNLKYDSGVAAKLVKLKPSGLGRGEIYLAALIRGSKVSGGGESYDLTIPSGAAAKEGPFAGKTKYEVKDYRTSKSQTIRLGVKGVITKQRWWRNQILPTLNLMRELLDSDAGLEWINQPDNKAVKEFTDYLLSTSQDGRTRFDFIPTGEFNKSKDLPAFLAAYKGLGKIAMSDKQGYDVMTLRGPNQKPVTFAVDIASTDVASNVETLNVKVVGGANIDQIITRLRRLTYIRKPDQIQIDLQNSVDSIVGNEIPFIVFRPDGINVLSDFKFAGISQGGVKIIEKG